MPPTGDDTAGENAATSDAAGESAPTSDAGGETAAGDAGDDGDAGGVDGQSRGAEAALSAAVDAADGDPDCALCSKPADYFLYETGRVEKFVCWEHVSPHSAAVDSEDARPGRPVALSL